MRLAGHHLLAQDDLAGGSRRRFAPQRYRATQPSAQAGPAADSPSMPFGSSLGQHSGGRGTPGHASHEIVMSIITREKVEQICAGVWRDRVAVLTVRGCLSGVLPASAAGQAARACARAGDCLQSRVVDRRDHRLRVQIHDRAAALKGSLLNAAPVGLSDLLFGGQVGPKGGGAVAKIRRRRRRLYRA